MKWLRVIQRTVLLLLLPLFLYGAAAFEPLPPPDGADFSPYLMTVSLASPVTVGHLTSPFGWRIHPITGVEDFHRGADIACPEGTEISAVLAGTVILARWDDSYGNFVLVDHYNGFQTLYAHCSKLLVKEGEHVKRGETVARSGQTGETTGPHLHLELRMDGIALDPAQLALFSSYLESGEESDGN